MGLSDLFWLACVLIVLGVVCLLVWRIELHRAHKFELCAEIDELHAILAYQARHVRHVCRPPAMASGPNPGHIGSHYQCPCGVRYVMVRQYRAHPDTPVRLGWVTTTEARSGVRPPWDRQAAENRLDGPPPAQPPGRHRTAAL